MKRYSSTIPGALLALLALAVQLAFGAAVPRVAVASPLQATSVICHAGDDSQTPPQPESGDCSLCPLCVLRAAPDSAVLAAAPVLRPSSRAYPWYRGLQPLPGSIQPAPGRDAQPRGPPVLA